MAISVSAGVRASIDSSELDEPLAQRRDDRGGELGEQRPRAPRRPDPRPGPPRTEPAPAA